MFLERTGYSMQAEFGTVTLVLVNVNSLGSSYHLLVGLIFHYDLQSIYSTYIQFVGDARVIPVSKGIWVKWI